MSHINLVYDLARHESSIAQWLERSTGILEFESHGRFRNLTLRHLFYYFTLTKSLFHLTFVSLWLVSLHNEMVPHYITIDRQNISKTELIMFASQMLSSRKF